LKFYEFILLENSTNLFERYKRKLDETIYESTKKLKTVFDLITSRVLVLCFFVLT